MSDHTSMRQSHSLLPQIALIRFNIKRLIAIFTRFNKQFNCEIHKPNPQQLRLLIWRYNVVTETARNLSPSAIPLIDFNFSIAQNRNATRHVIESKNTKLTSRKSIEYYS